VTTLRSGPPTGAMWGFVVDADTKVAVYAPAPAMCEVVRLLWVQRGPALRHLVPSACQQLSVAAPPPSGYAGPIYWMFVMDTGGELIAFGSKSQKMCQGIRDREAQGRGYALGECHEVLIKQLAAD
jgi:hypothetical protein